MTTIFLAQLFGLYFLLIGLFVLLRRNSVLPLYRELLNNRALLFVVAIIELAAGLAITLSYPTLSFTVEGAISLIGWMLTVEAIVYLLMPIKDVRKFVNSFNKAKWLVPGAVVAIVCGLYLTAYGFNLFQQ